MPVLQSVDRLRFLIEEKRVYTAVVKTFFLEPCQDTNP